MMRAWLVHLPVPFRLGFLTSHYVPFARLLVTLSVRTTIGALSAAFVMTFLFCVCSRPGTSLLYYYIIFFGYVCRFV